MSFKTSQPSNKNYLSEFGYKFVVSRLPNIVYFCQSVNMPSVNLGEIETGTPFVNLNYAGEHIEFGDLSLTFKVDENMENYLEIFNWILGLGFPEDFKQYRDLKATELENGGIQSDASLIILDSAFNQNLEIYFRDIFPKALTSLQFVSTTEDIRYITAQVVFSVRDFEINNLPNT